jgi:pyruvate kinase
MMYKLVIEAEGWIKRQREGDYKHNGTLTVHRPITPVANLNHMDGMAGTVVRASRSLGAKCIICLSRNGNTAINVAKYSPDAPIVAIVPNQKIGRFLQLHRAVHPVVGDRDLSCTTDTDRYGTAVEIATKLGFCDTGDTVIIVSYESAVQRLSEAVSMKVAKVTKMPTLEDRDRVEAAIAGSIPESAIQDQTDFNHR